MQLDRSELVRLYAEKSYLDAYAEHTDRRVRLDPRKAIGGMWDKIGELQFRFLLGQGLSPASRLLDIGCGTLRGGQHFIRYLDAGHYTGIDISREAIDAAVCLVHELRLAHKRPFLKVNETKSLRFGEFDHCDFDFLLAQSVFTHLMPEHIEECFAHIGRVMNENGRFYFTYHDAKERKRSGLKKFEYPKSFFRDLARRNGFSICDLSDAYDHPRGQRMLVAQR